MAAVTRTSSNSSNTGSSWPSSDTDIGSADELELSADALRACRKIDEIQSKKKANDRRYSVLTDPLYAEYEAAKDKTQQEILYRKMSKVIDTY